MKWKRTALSWLLGQVKVDGPGPPNLRDSHLRSHRAVTKNAATCGRRKELLLLDLLPYLIQLGFRSDRLAALGGFLPFLWSGRF